MRTTKKLRSGQRACAGHGTIIVRTTPELHRKLIRRARDEGRSLNGEIERALEAWVDDLRGAD